MSRLQSFVIVVAATLVVASGGFYLGRTTAGGRGDLQGATSSAAASDGERKVLYWQDPMNPGQKFDGPGKSPFMDMPLQPVYAGGAGDPGVRVSAQVQQNLGLRTATVKRAEVGISFDAVGTVQFDERLGVAVQTRVAGYLEHLSVRAPMERVTKGQVLGTVFAPDWLAARTRPIATLIRGCLSVYRYSSRACLERSSIPVSTEAASTLTSPPVGLVKSWGSPCQLPRMPPPNRASNVSWPADSCAVIAVPACSMTS